MPSADLEQPRLGEQRRVAPQAGVNRSPAPGRRIAASARKSRAPRAALAGRIDDRPLPVRRRPGRALAKSKSCLSSQFELSPPAPHCRRSVAGRRDWRRRGQAAAQPRYQERDDVTSDIGSQPRRFALDGRRTLRLQGTHTSAPRRAGAISQNARRIIDWLAVASSDAVFALNRCTRPWTKPSRRRDARGCRRAPSASVPSRAKRMVLSRLLPIARRSAERVADPRRQEIRHQRQHRPVDGERGVARRDPQPGDAVGARACPHR